MAIQAELVAAGTGQIMAHGGNSNPAVKAIMAAMFAGDSLPSLNFSKTADVCMQSVGGGTDIGGSGIGF